MNEDIQRYASTVKKYYLASQDFLSFRLTKINTRISASKERAEKEIFQFSIQAEQLKENQAKAERISVANFEAAIVSLKKLAYDENSNLTLEYQQALQESLQSLEAEENNIEDISLFRILLSVILQIPNNMPLDYRFLISRLYERNILELLLLHNKELSVLELYFSHQLENDIDHLAEVFTMQIYQGTALHMAAQSGHSMFLKTVLDTAKRLFDAQVYSEWLTNRDKFFNHTVVDYILQDKDTIHDNLESLFMTLLQLKGKTKTSKLIGLWNSCDGHFHLLKALSEQTTHETINLAIEFGQQFFDKKENNEAFILCQSGFDTIKFLVDKSVTEQGAKDLIPAALKLAAQVLSSIRLYELTFQWCTYSLDKHSKDALSMLLEFSNRFANLKLDKVFELFNQLCTLHDTSLHEKQNKEIEDQCFNALMTYAAQSLKSKDYSQLFSKRDADNNRLLERACFFPTWLKKIIDEIAAVCQQKQIEAIIFDTGTGSKTLLHHACEICNDDKVIDYICQFLQRFLQPDAYRDYYYCWDGYVPIYNVSAETKAKNNERYQGNLVAQLKKWAPKDPKQRTQSQSVAYAKKDFRTKPANIKFPRQWF